MIWQTLGLALGLNLAGFIIAYVKRSDKLTDFSYGLTFFLIALWSFDHGPKSSPAWWLFWLLAAWSARIGGFLLLRVLVNKKDRRFDGVRESFWKFGRFWLLQGLAAWIIMLPSTHYLGQPADRIGLVSALGLAVAAIGLGLETMADIQKFRFSRDPANKGRFITTGLWSYSRHPNYFGEILVWLGVYISTYPVLSFAERLVFAISPLSITYILLFVTGLPTLERYADQKWGDEKAYQSYKRRTSLLVPLPPKTRD